MPTHSLSHKKASPPPRRDSRSDNFPKKSWQLGSWLAAGGTPKVIHTIPRHGACSQARAIETSSRHFAAGRRLCCAASRCRVGSVRPKQASKNEARDTCCSTRDDLVRTPKPKSCARNNHNNTNNIPPPPPPPSSHRSFSQRPIKPTCFSGEGRVAINKNPVARFWGREV